jgi:hypothetical protein
MGFLSAFQQQSPKLHHQAPEKFSEILLKYMESLDARGDFEPRARLITLIVRAPSSAVVKAIAGHARFLAGRRVTARLLLARFTPAPLMKELLATLDELGGDEPAHDRIRWLKHPRLLDAHEQLVMGTEFCWTGDSLRRSEDRRNTLDIFSIGEPYPARLGAQSFAALWKASAAARLAALSEQDGIVASTERSFVAGATLARAGKDVVRSVLLPELKITTRH